MKLLKSSILWRNLKSPNKWRIQKNDKHVDAWIVWITLCCESIYCLNNYNFTIIQVLKTIKKTYSTSISKLNDVIRFLFFFDFFVYEIRKRLTIFDVNCMKNWDDTNDILKYQNKLYLSTIIRFDLITRNHDDSLTNHFEMKKTLELFKRKYYWSSSKKMKNVLSKINKFVKNYCEFCVICKKSKTSKHKSHEKFRFLFIFEYKWVDITINFVTNIFENKNWNDVVYDFIFVVVNRLFKMIHYVSCSKTIFVENLIEIFIRKIIKLHEVSTSIINDKKFVFIFKFWSTLCYALKIIKNLSMTFHFQIDDQTKRENNTMKQYFRVFVNFEQNDWVSLLFMTKFAYNNNKNASTNLSFFEIMTNYSFRMTFEEFFDFRVKLIFVKVHEKHLNNFMKMCKKTFSTIQQH